MVDNRHHRRRQNRTETQTGKTPEEVQMVAIAVIPGIIKEIKTTGVGIRAPFGDLPTRNQTL